MRVINHHRSMSVRLPSYPNIIDIFNKNKSFKIDGYDLRFTEAALLGRPGRWITLLEGTEVEPFGFVETIRQVHKEIDKALKFLDKVVTRFNTGELRIADLQNAIDLIIAFIRLLKFNAYISSTYYLARRIEIYDMLSDSGFQLTDELYREGE